MNVARIDHGLKSRPRTVRGDEVDGAHVADDLLTENETDHRGRRGDQLSRTWGRPKQRRVCRCDAAPSNRHGEDEGDDSSLTLNESTTDECEAAEPMAKQSQGVKARRACMGCRSKAAKAPRLCAERSDSEMMSDRSEAAPMALRLSSRRSERASGPPGALNPSTECKGSRARTRPAGE